MAAVPEYIHQQTEESLERWKERALKAEETIAEVQDVVGAPAKSKLAEVAKRIRRVIPGAFVDVYERFGFYQSGATVGWRFKITVTIGDECRILQEGYDLFQVERKVMAEWEKILTGNNIPKG